jgi:hypothetical protein
MKRKVNWISHILGKNFLLKHVIQGNIEGSKEITGRGGRRHKQLLNNLKGMRAGN